MTPKAPQVVLPQLPATPPPPIPQSSPGSKPGVKSQTNLSWLNAATGKPKGEAVGSASGVVSGAKQLIGQ